MTGLRFYIIQVGLGCNDAGYNFVGYNFATRESGYKRIGGGWMEFPLLCYLVQHPLLGNILIDVGCGPNEEGNRRPEEHTNINPAIIKREEYIDERLKQIGLSVEDIDMIVITHCHWDHIGGLEFFKGTKAIKNIIVPMKDFAYGLMQSHRSSKGYSDTLYYKWNIDIEGADYNILEEDTKLAEEIELVLLEGHTPDLIGVVIHLENGTYILPGDAVATKSGYLGDTRPSSIYDSLGYKRTLKKLKKMEKEYNAKMIFPHDPYDIESYKLFPDFYE